MSIMVSSHNLMEMEELNRQLKVHYYSLRLLVEEDNHIWSDARIQLLWERVSVMSDTVNAFSTLENCIRAGRDFNSDEPVLLDDSTDGAEPGHPEQ